MGGGLDARDDADQARLLTPSRNNSLEPVDVVEVVDHDQADAVLDGQFEFLVCLGVAVQHQPSGIGAGLQRGQDLAATGDVEVQTFFGHHSLNGRARARL